MTGPREIVLIPNTRVQELGLMFMELNAICKENYLGELGTPEQPTQSDYTPALHVSEEVRERVRRYAMINNAEVAVKIYDVRIDVAGNVVGKVTPFGPRAGKIEKALHKPKCGLTVYPRVGYAYNRPHSRATVIFAFDVGYK